MAEIMKMTRTMNLMHNAQQRNQEDKTCCKCMMQMMKYDECADVWWDMMKKMRNMTYDERCWKIMRMLEHDGNS